MLKLQRIKTTDYKTRLSEAGNVLFLILIAVALFAALSYAVTSSSRSGGSDASEETSLISSASITQYPASIRTAIVRMIVSDGVADTELEFNSPSSFGTCTVSGAHCVFHADGGGATYSRAPADAMANGQLGTWYFNAGYEITNVGRTSPGSAVGNDIIAFLPDIKSSLCTKLNSELGLSGDLTMTADINPAGDTQMTNGYSIPGVEIGIIGTAGGAAGFDAQPYGCITDGGGDYIYYHVLVER